MFQFITSSRTDNSNDALVNTLVKREFIHLIYVEKVFRSVDRGLYYTNDNKLNAYRDTDWRSGDVHLCAPSVYAVALECLNLHKAHKFLNIGSGIGYLSTLAGLLLGDNGVNHGIEILGSLIEIANQKLEEFKQNSAAIDYFEFCEPVFIEGNAYELLPVGYYDRVFCGAAVPPAESSFMKALIKIGGVLVMPLEGSLVKVIRKDVYTWQTFKVLEVSFAELFLPEKFSSMKVAKFPTIEPLSLQKLCRSNIRASVRDSLNETHSGLQMRIICKPNKSYIPINQFVAEYDETERGMVSLQSIVGTFDSMDDTISDLDSSSGNWASEEDKINSLFTVTNLLNFRSTNSSINFWETISSYSFEPYVEENDHNGDGRIYNPLVNFEINRDRGTDSKVAKELIDYCFQSKRTENKLSKLLKVKIDLLPVPAAFKLFLNYIKED